MEIKEIQALIKLMAANGVNEVEINRKDFKIHITKNATQVVNTNFVPTTTPVSNSAIPMSPEIQMMSPVKASVASVETESSHLITIKSPMVGTFYRTPNPDAPSFVNVGDVINIGKAICVIEAMKLFNEIESEVNGKIVKVLVENSSPIEYDQPLFLVEPA
ncbi:MAG: acetyl-CoA carboxylase, biotin carboxyl carrier protein [Flavobacteriales bacterium]|nr:acetyl-CoA carboxylase biotin carboxyl carrier protein [Flavobacteriaceae bacterium]PHX91971.1 MAG: acetyl-CoA carboxylase, biotin carboxyl carrier protein [Flavobacteriales bacterium]